jgi:hypothetical protein
MRATARRILLLLGLFFMVAFVVFLINQTAQLVALAARASPVLGQATFWLLIFVYAACLLVPAWLLLRLPRPIAPPDSDDAAAIEEHVARLAARLRKNEHVAGRALATRADVEAAIAVLDERANEMTRVTASQVFLTTAISQNGSLDAIVVLAAQSRLILRVARTYWQRPTLRDLLSLYGNVAATALITSELDDIDLSQQIQPVLSSLLGSAAGAVPGLQVASTLLVNSVMTGSANAFLTLRIGIITRRYCGAVVRPPRGMLRRYAALQATQMLGGIALDGATSVSSAVVRASKRAIGDTVSGMGAAVKRAGSAVIDRFRPGGDPGDPDEPLPQE